MTQMGTVQGLFQVFVRQAGQDQYKDGAAGFDVNTATKWFEWGKKIQDLRGRPERASRSRTGRRRWTSPCSPPGRPR